MRVVRIALVAGALACVLGGAARAAETAPTVVSMRLSGVVDPFEADYIEGGIQAAEDQGADAVLLTMDTPGGLDSSMRKIVQAIDNASIPVICYTSPSGARAASAGTFIMMSCPVAAMAPGTAIGAAHPVGVSGIIEQKKVTNDAVALIRGLAQQWGRNADWAEDAVRQAISASANEALRLNVIDLVEPNVPTLLDAVDGRTVSSTDGSISFVLHTADATVDDRGMGIGGAFLHALLNPAFAFIFFYGGIILIILEILHPGIGVAGILGLLSLAGSLVSFGMLPVNLIGIVLLLASVGFFLLELKAPGFGGAGLAGVITLVAGALFLFDPSVPNARVSPWVIVPVALFTALFFGFVVKAAWAARKLPRQTGRQVLTGTEGVVTSVLEPLGVVQVAGERWTAESAGGTIPVGTRVRVVGMDGLTLRVEPVGTPGDDEPADGERVQEGSVT